MYLRQIPNIITFFRILLVPILVALFLTEPFDRSHLWWGFSIPIWTMIVVIVAGVTDMIDGMVARKWGFHSTFGQLMDPIADKIFMTTGFIFLTHLQRLSPIGVVLLVVRDTVINAVRGYAGTHGMVIPARGFGKWKTALQFVALCMGIYWEGQMGWWAMGEVGEFLFWVSLVLGYIALIQYIWAFRKAMAAK